MIGQLTTIWNYRYFWMSLVQMDLQIRYRRSLIGIGWSMLNPILMTIVFCLVFSEWNKQSDWRQSAPYFLGGIAIWEYIKNSTLLGCSTFFSNESYIRQVPLPVAIYHLRTVLGTTIHFLISMIILLITITVLTRTSGAPHAAQFWDSLMIAGVDQTQPLYWLRAFRVLPIVIPSLVMAFIFAWSCSTIAGFLTVYLQDAKYLLEVFFTIFFFLTPILYPVQRLYDSGMGILAEGNPAVLFFGLIRDPMLFGIYPDMALVIKGMVMTLTTFLVAIGMIYKLEKKLIFHL
jgi:lipopolysaccharide transport system permease protein